MKLKCHMAYGDKLQCDYSQREIELRNKSN